MIIEQRHMHNYPNEIDIKELRELYSKTRMQMIPDKTIFKNIDKFNLDEGEEIYFIKNAKRIYFKECDVNDTLYIEDPAGSITIENSSIAAPLFMMRNMSNGNISIKNSILNSLHIYDSCNLNEIVLYNSKIEKLYISHSIINRGIKIVDGERNENGLHIFEESKTSKIDELTLFESYVNQSFLEIYNRVRTPSSVMTPVNHFYEGSLKDITSLIMIDSFIAYDRDLINLRGE